MRARVCGDAARVGSHPTSNNNLTVERTVRPEVHALLLVALARVVLHLLLSESEPSPLARDALKRQPLAALQPEQRLNVATWSVRHVKLVPEQEKRTREGEMELGPAPPTPAVARFVVALFALPLPPPLECADRDEIETTLSIRAIARQIHHLVARTHAGEAVGALRHHRERHRAKGGRDLDLDLDLEEDLDLDLDLELELELELESDRDASDESDIDGKKRQASLVRRVRARTTQLLLLLLLLLPRCFSCPLPATETFPI